VVETPGGWSDFVSQNPGFFARQADAPVRSAAPARVRPPSAKLSYRDERHLAELEAELPRLAATIAALEARLADADLYARDPAAFDRGIRDLDITRKALAAAEDTWLELETIRESLGRGAR
jgi:ATP-binding cassette subfamily F protein uup